MTLRFWALFQSNFDTQVEMEMGVHPQPDLKLQQTWAAPQNLVKIPVYQPVLIIPRVNQKGSSTKIEI